MNSRKSATWLSVQDVLVPHRVSLWVVDPAFDDLERGGEDTKR